MLDSTTFKSTTSSINAVLVELGILKEYLEEVFYFSYRDQDFTRLSDAPLQADWEPIPESLSDNVYLLVPEGKPQVPETWQWWQNRLFFHPPFTVRVGGSFPPQTYFGYGLNTGGQLVKSNLYVRSQSHADEILQLLRNAYVKV